MWLRILCNDLLLLYFNFIVVYQLGLGSIPGEDDTVPLLNVSYETSQYCFASLQLQHTHTYYSTVVAWNGGLVERNASAVSDGGVLEWYK